LSLLSGEVGVVASPQSSQLGSSTRTQAYTRCDAEINNEHSSNAKTPIRTNWWACHNCNKRHALHGHWCSGENRSMHGTKANHHRQVKWDKRRWLRVCAAHRGLVDMVQVFRRTHRAQPRWQLAATCSSALKSSVSSTVAALVRLELAVVPCLVKRKRNDISSWFGHRIEHVVGVQR
jgi:hypothetical protein